MRDFKLNEILKFDLSPLVNLKPKSPPLEKVARTFQSNIERNQGVFTLLPGIVFVSMRHQQATAEATFKVLGHPTPTDQEKVQPVLKERMLEELKKELEKRAAEDNANRPAASDAILRGGIHNVQQFASSLPLSLGVGTEALLNSIIISAWTSFEVITSDVWTTAIDYGPEKLTDKIYLNLARQTKIKDEGGLVFSLRSKPGSFFLETQQVSFQSIRAIYEAYELAFRMQTTVPEVFHFAEESAETRAMYGLDQEETMPFGQRCLTARRLVERGVRFVQVFHGAGSAGLWDAHSELQKNHSKTCRQVDQPIAALLKDLKQRGLLDETLVVWGTEFGRSPGVEGARGGRDHHPFGFTVWMAGGGIKGGVAHGATDELGFHAVEKRHYVTDIHATVLHQLGLDPRRLVVPGQKRLEIDFGAPIREIIA